MPEPAHPAISWPPVETPEPSAFPVGSAALITTHFGDVRWVELLLRRTRAAFPGLPDQEVYVNHQDRTAESAAQPRHRLGDVTGPHLPLHEPHVLKTGHDHAHVLNLAVREIDAPYLVLFDSDAHPVSPAAAVRLGALVRDNDAVLAGLDGVTTRAHPCFMLFGPAVDREALRFDEGQLETGVDTGRMVFDQVGRAGLRAELLRPS